jgi:hypothetical protein
MNMPSISRIMSGPWGGGRSFRRCMTGRRRWARSSGPITAGSGRCGMRGPAMMSEEAQRTWDREGPWFGAVREECLAVRDACGILDLPGFSRFRVTGRGRWRGCRRRSRARCRGRAAGSGLFRR